MRELLPACLLLAGCGGPSLSANQKSEVADIADDAATDAAADAIANTNAVDGGEMDKRLAALESSAERSRQADVTTLNVLGEINEKYVSKAQLDEFVEHYNKHLKDYHGGK